ncbi:NAD(P)-dependent dehydrogenase (short-subunit alcohol dehydrogenase family) [Paraburkholderia sp. BL6665CI2N2]|uniref:SDR family NAD(P)-dependent oxidoreductase n=1 Tax=Paraburkholderia sp. BL6665CI2N2 TaxID=1938806 RepID=UPI0010656AD2|nr:SDR family oxidoreductase [Paraburkholderia sp. BL6665CI2N2]TDY22938.1 NAD(P)-dependent dehydrogenase (short-subunit alcohol dehydrogenase family) [Paraburkholderia sp. BL6665CI2N2]
METTTQVKQRHAVVTGASSGIGLAITQRLLNEGWRVTGLCRRPATQAVEHLTIVPVDVTDFAALAPVVESIGACDAFVHAAGFMRTAPLGELSADDGAAMWRIHVDSAAFLANALLPNMPAGGRIVLIGSRTANGAPTRSQYAATKAALVGMARSWAAELAPRGITVNVVAPGATDTPLLRDPARAGTPPKMPPLGRFVQPSEVAGLTAFLLGPEGGSITGQQIVMCGGASL